jgi:hypothetical protein
MVSKAPERPLPSDPKELPLMRFAFRLLLICSLFVCAGTTSASAADHMWFGFQDDPTFRWREDRVAMFDRVTQFDASILRSTVYWARTAPKRPASATNPFDPAYHWDDLDEFVRNAATRDISVMLTIWGTPSWANGGKGQNVAPTKLADLTNFARAVANRYNGTHPGLPFVQFYGVWNESNLGQFLTPQYDKNNKPVSPFIYANLYRAAYAGIKAGNPRAKVGIGETAPRGRTTPLHKAGVQETLAPGTFARLLSTVRPALKFDAWSHHPYSSLGFGPLQKTRFPNVNLPQIPQFESNLNAWFHRKETPIWISEYGFETKPGEPKGVTPSQQVAYLKQSVTMARNMTYVTMYVWFIFRDDPTSTWQSGLLNTNSSEKLAANVYPALARLVDGRNPILTVRSGTSQPLVSIPVTELAARDGAGAMVFSTARAYLNGNLIGVAQPSSVVTTSGYVSLPAPIPSVVKNVTYVVSYELSDVNGNRLYRYVTIGGV